MRGKALILITQALDLSGDLTQPFVGGFMTGQLVPENLVLLGQLLDLSRRCGQLCSHAVVTLPFGFECFSQESDLLLHSGETPR